MNSIFGGQVSAEELRKISALHEKYSASFSPFEPRVHNAYENGIALSSITGKNLAAGIGRYGGLTVAVNGDIYNRDIANGSPGEHNFQNNTHNVALRLARRYAEHGPDFVRDVNGSFVVAVHDKDKGRIVLARDHQGIGRPFYYSLHCGRFRFGSRLWSLVIGRSAVARNTDDEYFYFIQGFFPGHTTAVRGIYKMCPSEVLVYDIREEKYAVTERTSTFSWPEYSARNLASVDGPTAEEYTREAFLKSTREIARGVKKAGVLLGGVDSALVAAGLRRIGIDVETFSFLTPDPRCNQTKVDRVSSFLGIRHNWFNEDVKLIGEELPRMPYFIDEPRAELTYMLGTRAISAYARDKGCDAVFTGDATEDLMMGYPTIHDRVRMVEQFSHIPAWLRAILVATSTMPCMEVRLGHPYRNLIGLLRKAGTQPPSRHCFTYRIFDEMSLPRMFNNFEPERLARYYETVERLSAPFSGLSPVMRGHQGNLLSASIRYKLPGTADSSDIHLRTPFNHLGFIRFMQMIPDHVQYPRGQVKSEDAKILLKGMGKRFGLLPNDVIDQKKLTPGSTPIDYWLERDLKQRAMHILEKLPDDFNRGYISRLFARKPLMEVYRGTLSINRVTSFDIALLVSYSLFWEHIHLLRSI